MEEEVSYANNYHCLMNKMKMDEEKQNILTTKEEVNFVVTGSNAAQKFQLEAEINFDLQHKQIKVCLLLPSLDFILINNHAHQPFFDNSFIKRKTFFNNFMLAKGVERYYFFYQVWHRTNEIAIL